MQFIRFALPIMAALAANASAAVLPPATYSMANGQTGFGNYRDTIYSPDPNGNAQVSYGLLQGGTGKLSDGIIGTDDIFQNNFVEWVGWLNFSPRITYFFPQPVLVDGVRVHVANNSSAFNDVAVPATALVEFLDAGSSVLGSTNWSATAADTAGTQSRWLSLFAGPSTSASAVRITLNTGRLPWIFASELEVTGVIPAPASAALLAMGGLIAGRRRRA